MELLPIHPLVQEILENGLTRSWYEYAEQFDIRPDGNRDQRRKAAHGIWRNYTQREGNKDLPPPPDLRTTANPKDQNLPPSATSEQTQGDFHSKHEKDGEILTETYSDRLYTVEEMAAFHKIDMDIWEPSDIKTNYWEVGAKMKRADKSTYFITSPLHQLTVKWRLKDTTIQAFEERRTELEDSFQLHFLEYKKPQPGEFQTWIILPDVHAPFENKFLFDAVLKFMQETPLSGIILSGDFLDLKSLSGYDSDKVQDFNLMDEYIAGREAIMKIESVLPVDAKKIYLNGNHEARYYKELKKLSGAKLGPALLSPDIALRLQENEWEYLPNWQEDFVLLGNNLEIIHGSLTSKQAATQHLAKSSVNGRSVIFGHTHRFAFASSGKFAAWNIGCLADINNINAFGYVDRFVRQEWQNGFALVTIDENGEHYVTPVKCDRRSFFLNGKQY